MATKSIQPFLELMIDDNETFNFPVEVIRKELLQLMISNTEFEYMIRQAFRVIKSKYGVIIANIFVNLLDYSLKDVDSNVHELDEDEYTTFIYNFIELLESVKITRVDSESPDYEVINAMQ